jgi:hypothetical protein
MRGVAELAIIAGAGALLALLLDAFGLSSATVWRWASAALAMGWAVAALFASRRIRKAGGRMIRASTLLVVPFLVYSGILLLAWNTIAPDASSGRVTTRLWLLRSARQLSFSCELPLNTRRRLRLPNKARQLSSASEASWAAPPAARFARGRLVPSGRIVPSPPIAIRCSRKRSEKRSSLPGCAP